jgi:carbon monoxide dehydrogenase subunit G
MHFSGIEYINNSFKNSWDFLMDVSKVASCAPGFKGLIPTGSEGNAWEVELELKVLLLKIRMVLDVRRPTADEVNGHMAIAGSGTGSGGGVNFMTDIHLAPLAFGHPEIEHTGMVWDANVEVVGKLANLGAKVMQGFIEKQTAAFFACLVDAV